MNLIVPVFFFNSSANWYGNCLVMCVLAVDKNIHADRLVLYYLNDFVGAFSARRFEGDLIAHRLSHECLSQW